MQAIYSGILDLIKARLNKCCQAEDSTRPELDLVMTISGQISRLEVELLYQLAQEVKQDAVIVEIGSYRGRSTIALALGAKKTNLCSVYAIDPHDAFVGILGGVFGPEDKEELYKNIVHFKVGSIVSVICMKSAQASAAWASDNIGLLWIDGDHQYEAVSCDFLNWSKHLIDGGIVCLHDCHLESVQRLVSEIESNSKYSLVCSVDSTMVFKKTNKNIGSDCIGI